MRSFEVRVHDGVWLTTDEICTIAKTLSQRYNDDIVDVTVTVRPDGDELALKAEGVYDPCYSLSATARVEPGYMDRIVWG